jgi:hypothetical protein
LSEDFPMFIDQIGQPMDENGPVIRRQRRPTALSEGFMRGPDGGIHIARVTRGHSG